MIPRIRIGDLPGGGKRELVQIIILLNEAFPVQNHQDAVKKLCGPRDILLGLETPNGVLILGYPETAYRVIDYVKALPEPAKKP